MYARIKECPDENLKLIKTNKGASKIFSTVYFIGETIIGYYVLNQTDFFPPACGGTGKWENIWKDFPIFDDPKYALQLKYYFLGTLGYHISSTVLLIQAHIKARRPDFMEMMLHHIVTIFCFTMGWMCNFTKGSALVIFMHAWADIMVSFLKFLVESTYSKYLVYSVSILTDFVWAYSRLYVYPMLIWYGMHVLPVE